MGESFIVDYFFDMRRCPTLTPDQARGFSQYYQFQLQSTCTSSARALVGGEHLSSSQAHYHPKSPMNTFSRRDPRMPQSLFDQMLSGAIFRSNSNSKSMFSGSPNYTNSPNNNFSSRERMHEPQIVNQYKQVPESSFFPLFTATNTRVQTSQNLYYSRPPSTYRYPTMETDRFPRREPRMPQSLFDQMSSGAIFRGNPNRNQTVTQYNLSYTAMPMSQPSPQNHCHPSVFIASMRAKPEEILSVEKHTTNLRYYREVAWM